MPFIHLARSPVRPALTPVRIHYRERGAGPAVMVLHGGWGYEAYSFDPVMTRLAERHRVVAPDRTGYGQSGRLPELPDGFHQRMAEETVLVMDALGVDSAALWGHSDGAVVAAWTAILFPDRVRALVLEAVHHVAHKASSVEFFQTAVEAPERFGDLVVAALERDHGASWREVIAAGGRAWLSIIEQGRRGRKDVYDGRLPEVRAPTLLIHGRRDPRTEPGELEAVMAALPHARLALFDAGHSPHTGSSAAGPSTAVGIGFLAGTAGARMAG